MPPTPQRCMSLEGRWQQLFLSGLAHRARESLGKAAGGVVLLTWQRGGTGRALEEEPRWEAGL